MVTVCEWFGLKTTRTVFAGLVSKPVATISSGLASKSTATVFAGLASKPVATVSPNLASKPAVSFLVEPQNQCGGGFSGLDLKTGSSGLVIWVSNSPRRFFGFGLKIKWATVYWLRYKTDGGRSARDTHRDLVACFMWRHMTPSRRLRRKLVEDGRVDAMGCVGPCYPTFAVFNILGPRDIVVI
jgi:hypothetical protein